jgi:5-hydroxyisourate hydrolase-like protein (transthyretin family)
MKRSMMRLALVPMCCLLFCSCGEKEGQDRKETFPVTGVVHVDGKAIAKLAVRCTDVNGMDRQNPTKSSAFTDEDGKFEISTYEKSDGMPEGDYVLTFQWGQWNMISASYGGPDKLNGRYMDPAESEVKFTVKAGEPTDLGTIELTTK